MRRHDWCLTDAIVWLPTSGLTELIKFEAVYVGLEKIVMVASICCRCAKTAEYFEKIHDVALRTSSVVFAPAGSGKAPDAETLLGSVSRWVRETTEFILLGSELG